MRGVRLSVRRRFSIASVLGFLPLPVWVMCGLLAAPIDARAQCSSQTVADGCNHESAAEAGSGKL